MKKIALLFLLSISLISITSGICAATLQRFTGCDGYPDPNTGEPRHWVYPDDFYDPKGRLDVDECKDCKSGSSCTDCVKQIQQDNPQAPRDRPNLVCNGQQTINY
jgi:hypothetical protein